MEKLSWYTVEINGRNLVKHDKLVFFITLLFLRFINQFEKVVKLVLDNEQIGPPDTLGVFDLGYVLI